MVDDSPAIRESLRNILQKEPRIEIVGEAEDGPEGVELAKSLRPDVVLMDVQMHEMHGREATRLIVAQNPKIKVIAQTATPSPSIKQAMLQAGACAFIDKASAPKALLPAIRRATKELRE